VLCHDTPLFWWGGRRRVSLPCVVGRQPFGRIAIANADAGAYAYTDSAIDQAYRAVREIVASTPSAPKGTPPA
jgi:hypothetical protein